MTPVCFSNFSLRRKSLTSKTTEFISCGQWPRRPTGPQKNCSHSRWHYIVFHCVCVGGLRNALRSCGFYLRPWKYCCLSRWYSIVFHCVCAGSLRNTLRSCGFNFMSPEELQSFKVTLHSFPLCLCRWLEKCIRSCGFCFVLAVKSCFLVISSWCREGLHRTQSVNWQWSSVSY